MKKKKLKNFKKGISKRVVLKETVKSLILAAAKTALRRMNAHSLNERANTDSQKQYLNASIVNCFIGQVKNEKKRQKRF